MTMATRTGICLLGVALWQWEACGDTPQNSDNPYQGIVLRNLFGLKPIPPPPPPPEPPKPPAPPITLNGITTILGNKRALLSYTSSPKPGEPAKLSSVMLAEGQRDGEIEVMEIDVTKGEEKVKVNAFGAISTINFKDNGAKMAAAAPPAVAANPGFPPPPAGLPNPFAPPGAGGSKAIPGRPLRLPTGAGGGPGGTPSAANGVNGVNGANPGAAPQGASFNGFGQPAQQQAAFNSPIAPEANRTPEEDVIMTEVDRERHRGEANYPPLPPTSLTSPEDLKAIMAPGWDTPVTKPRGLRPQ